MPLSYSTTGLSRAGFVYFPAKQRGITLLISLIVLVAMTLAAISLMRSMDTTNVIAGNLAFRQSANSSGDVGIESAIYWLEQNNGANLFSAQPGYSAIHDDPALGQSWDAWWTQVALTRGLIGAGTNVTVAGATLGVTAGTGGGVVTLPTDASTGNTVSYTIDRMCKQAVDPLTPGANCEQTTSTGKTGSSQTSGSQGLTTSTQIYYRITSRTAGPHNSVSYVQAVIAL